MPAETTLALNADDLLVETLTDLLVTLTATRPGVVLEGLPTGPWLASLLAGLADDANWYLTLVGADPATATALPELDSRTGLGAEHAVAMRNENVVGARRLVVKLGEEARLHSLTERGYYALGPDEVARAIAERGANQAGTEPQRRFWRQLATGCPAVPLAGLLRVAARNWSAPDSTAADLRHLLPDLNLLPDQALFDNPRLVGERLLDNESLLDTLIQQDPQDLDKAFTTCRRAVAEYHPDAERLRAAFAAFRHLNPASEQFGEELKKLDVTLVDGLLNNRLRKVAMPPPARPVPPSLVPPEPTGGGVEEPPASGGEDGWPGSDRDEPTGGGDDDNPAGGDDGRLGGAGPGGGGSPRPPRPPKKVKEYFSDPLDQVVLQMSAEAKWEDWQLEANKLWESLEKQLNEKKYRLEGDQVEVSGEPDARALLLTQHFAGEQAFGGSLPQTADLHPGQPLPVVDVTLPPAALVQGEAWLAGLRQLLAVGAELVPGFAGEAKLQAWLDQRAVLAKQAALLTLAPLTTLIARPALLTAARAMSRAYEELLAHVREFYPQLDQAGGAAEISAALLAPDLLAVPGPTQQAALLSPLHPLTLWKYATIADELQAGWGAELRPLLGQLDDAPEPLRALVLPELNGQPAAQLAYVRRVGAWVQYQQAGPVEVSTSGNLVRDAARKLAILYPLVRRQLRLLVHHPDSLDKLKPALNDLLKEDGAGGFEQIQLILTYRPGQEGALSLSLLEDLISRGLVVPERVEIANTDKLAEWLRLRPAHLLVLPGQRRLEPLLVSRQATDLHPLSLPHTLQYNQFKGEVSLLPRSQQRDPNGPEHPFGAYHDLASAVSRLPNQEVSGASLPRATSPDLPALLPYAVFVVAGAPADAPAGALPLARPHGSRGDLVLTQYADRFTKGVAQMLTQSNYQPRTEVIFELLRELEEVGCASLFATISAKTPGGFDASALTGQLGEAVALRWYLEQATDARRVIISLNSDLARPWLAHRESARRHDFLGLRWLPNGGISLDLIEVKSRKNGEVGEVEGEGTPGEQLRAVARALLPVVSGQSGPGGKLVTDCRREYIRVQLFQEGQLRMPAGYDRSTWASWIQQLNQALDGQLAVEVNLLLTEVLFNRNEEVRQIWYPGDATASEPEKRLGVLREQLGEPAIRRLLGELPPTLDGPTTAAGPAPSAPVAPVVPAGPTKPTEPTAPKDSPAAPPVASSMGEAVPETKAAVAPLVAAGLEPLADALGRNEPVAPQEPAERTESLDLSDESETLPPTPAEAGTVVIVPPPASVVAQLATNLYRALQNHGLAPVKAIDPTIADIGPSLIRLKVLLKGNQKVGELQRLAGDLMREMKLDQPPVIGNLPGTGFVAVEVGRSDRQPVALGPVLAAGRHEPPVSFPAGVGTNGKVQWLNLPRLPHMLIGGTTGSGKTMFLYGLIKALTELNGPETVELVLIDPKQTDFGFFENLPHLRERRIVYEPADAVGVLNDLLSTELPRRTTLLRQSGCRDIHEYRQQPRPESLPFTIVVIDEFADLIQSLGTKDRKQFEENVGRLAQRTRSVGIHLVVATQRPDMKVIPGNLKNNLDCRVAFRLASGTDSRVILDETGAEDLLGAGDMLLKQQGQIQRLQGFFVPSSDLRN